MGGIKCSSVSGSPFLCRVTDGDGDDAARDEDDDIFSRVSVDLEHLSHIPLTEPSSFTIKVAGGDDAELAVSVQGN